MLTSNGKFCESCGVCTDSVCIKKADQLIKCKDKVVQNSDTISHLWVKGNLPFHTVCCICDKDVDYHAEPGLHGYRCCWCQRSLHNHCFAKVSKCFTAICDYGDFRTMIIPPTSLVVTEIRGSRKLKLKTIILPNVPNWKPLFVIGNYDHSVSSI